MIRQNRIELLQVSANVSTQYAILFSMTHTHCLYYWLKSMKIPEFDSHYVGDISFDNVSVIIMFYCKCRSFDLFGVGCLI